jgi:hypothetical protein
MARGMQPGLPGGLNPLARYTSQGTALAAAIEKGTLMRVGPAIGATEQDQQPQLGSVVIADGLQIIKLGST